MRKSCFHSSQNELTMYSLSTNIVKRQKIILNTLFIAHHIVYTQLRCAINNELFHNILNELFFYFENNIFVNDGVCPRSANLIFAFSDYIENMLDEEISFYINSEKKDDIENFRLVARQGIEYWLKQNMKTLMI